MDQLTNLFTRYLNKSATSGERLELFELVKSFGQDEALEAAASQVDLSSLPEMNLPEEVSKEIYQAILSVEPPVSITSLHSENWVHRVHFLKTAWFRYAAVLLLIAGTVTFLYLNNQPQRKTAIKQKTVNPAGILPGGNKATLTLSDGSTILLDSAANGALASEGTTKIIKLAAGSLTYQGNDAAGEIGFNTISTPRGGQYRVVLSDGTRVWLNAASSIRFPAAFAKERNVIVTGEAYLEIMKDRTKPFFVQAGAERIEVLGTSLNVNAYSNEPAIVTTLLEGSIQVNNIMLSPGEACANGKKYKTEASRAIAWKNGLFNFQDQGLRAVMRQLERWYDIEVDIPVNMPDIDFYGKMSRGLTLEDVLRAIKGSGIHYTMEGRKLMLQQ